MLRAIVTCAVVALAGCASAPSAPKAAPAAALTCLNPSASRIPAKPGQCATAPGRVYTQTDIEQTGKLNAGEALQMLDPSVSVHH